jgi:hypothetical protein
MVPSQSHREKHVVATIKETIEVNIRPVLGGGEALHLSIVYGNRNAEVNILLRPEDTRTRDKNFIRSEVSQLSAALEVLAKTHGT